MKQALLALVGICMMAALCEQLLDGRRSFPAVRMALGMQAALMAVRCLAGIWNKLNG